MIILCFNKNVKLIPVSSLFKEEMILEPMNSRSRLAPIVRAKPNALVRLGVASFAPWRGVARRGVAWWVWMVESRNPLVNGKGTELEAVLMTSSFIKSPCSWEEREQTDF